METQSVEQKNGFKSMQEARSINKCDTLVSFRKEPLENYIEKTKDKKKIKQKTRESKSLIITDFFDARVQTSVKGKVCFHKKIINEESEVCTPPGTHNKKPQWVDKSLNFEMEKLQEKIDYKEMDNFNAQKLKEKKYLKELDMLIQTASRRNREKKFD